MDPQLGALLAECVYELEREVPYASALAMEREGERIVVQNKRRIVEEIEAEVGAVLTVFTGDRFLESSVSDPSPRALAQAVQSLKERARYEGIRYNGLDVDPGEKQEESFRVFPEIPPERTPLQEKVDRIARMQKRLGGEDPRVREAVCRYEYVRERERFVNRNKQLYQRLCRTQVTGRVVLSDSTRSVSLHTGRCVQGGWEHARLEEGDLAELVADARAMLHARRLEPGTYDVILSPDFAGILAHEAFGHGVEADLFLKKRARGEAFLGKSVASPLVTLLDDPSLPGQAGSYFFDHEGQRAAPTAIIENGILKRALTDLNSAVRLNLPRTANGRRESYCRKVYARMSNTFFAAGTNSLDDMLSDMDSGYLLDRPSNGMEDPKGWGIQLEGFVAREIRNGRVTGNIFSPVIVTGTVPELLHSITLVGDRVEISGLGICGKGYKEWVKVTDGGPYLRLRARLG